MSALAGSRADLLELGVPALTALANAGFVKRAQKDLDEGRAPDLAEDADGTVHAVFDDGHRARLPAGRPLRDATCSCPASGLCRHRVTLVLAYQRAVAAARSEVEPAPEVFVDWSPADFDDDALAAALAPATLQLARQLAADHPVVRVDAASAGAPTPTVRLPTSTVRFYSRHNLQLAHCDCREATACAHVALAVWAFRQAREQARADAVAFELRPAQSVSMVAGGDAAADAARADLDALLLQLWLDGSSQPETALAMRMASALARAEALGWRWVVDALTDLDLSLQAQRRRSSRFDPRHLLALVAELPARLAAARAADAAGPAAFVPARQVLGVGVRGETALDQLRLVALGLECWRDDRGDGARVVFADPDTQRLMVLERDWPAVADATPLPIVQRRVAGQSLRTLARSQVVTQSARRRANGAIEIAPGARHTSVLPLAPHTWENLGAPLRETDAAARVARLRAAPPAFVQPRQAIEDLVVLPVGRVPAWGWDAAAQCLRAQVLCSAAGDECALEPDAANVTWWSLPHQLAATGAVDALAAVLAGDHGAVRAVAGTAHVVGGQLHLVPTIVFCADAVVVPQAADATPRGMPAWTGDDPRSARALALDAARDWLIAQLRHGLRHSSGDAPALAGSLEKAGLAHAAALLRSVARDMRAADRSHLPGRLATLVLLLDGIGREPD